MALRIGNSTERKRSMEKFIRLLFLSALVFLLIAAGSIACKKGADEQADSQENSCRQYRKLGRYIHTGRAGNRA